MKTVRLALIALCVFGLTACGDGLLHRIDQQQGNVLTEDMVAQLKPNMDREQVLFIMGQPVLKNSFDSDRWDYIYTFAPGSRNPEKKQLTLYFEDNKLVRLVGSKSYVPIDEKETDANGAE